MKTPSNPSSASEEQVSFASEKKVLSNGVRLTLLLLRCLLTRQLCALTPDEKKKTHFSFTMKPQTFSPSQERKYLYPFGGSSLTLRRPIPSPDPGFVLIFPLSYFEMIEPGKSFPQVWRILLPTRRAHTTSEQTSKLFSGWKISTFCFTNF